MRIAEFLGGRHEISQANEAHERASAGDHTLLHRIRHIPDRDFPLTDEGTSRSVRKGHWLLRSGLLPFDVCFVSEFQRAQQTAFHLALPGVEWLVDSRLNERDWGSFGQLSSSERDAHCPGWKKAKEAAPLDWRPEGSETLREKAATFGDFWRDINRRYAGLRIYCQAHGETLQAAQICIEGLTQEKFAAHERSYRLGNGCIVHYHCGRGYALKKRVIDPHKDTYSEWHAVSPLAV